MKNLTLIVPAKNESESLPEVLKEIKDYECKIIIILEESDTKTIEVAKNFNELEAMFKEIENNLKDKLLPELCSMPTWVHAVFARINMKIPKRKSAKN